MHDVGIRSFSDFPNSVSRFLVVRSIELTVDVYVSVRVRWERHTIFKQRINYNQPTVAAAAINRSENQSSGIIIMNRKKKRKKNNENNNYGYQYYNGFPARRKPQRPPYNILRVLRSPGKQSSVPLCVIRENDTPPDRVYYYYYKTHRGRVPCVLGNYNLPINPNYYYEFGFV